MSDIPKVKLVSKDLDPRRASFTIGDQMLPFYEATAYIKVGEPVKITVTVPAHLVDVEALQKDTEVMVKGLPPEVEIERFIDFIKRNDVSGVPNPITDMDKISLQDLRLIIEKWNRK